MIGTFREPIEPNLAHRNACLQRVSVSKLARAPARSCLLTCQTPSPALACSHSLLFPVHLLYSAFRSSVSDDNLVYTTLLRNQASEKVKMSAELAEFELYKTYETMMNKSRLLTAGVSDSQQLAQLSQPNALLQSAWAWLSGTGSPLSTSNTDTSGSVDLQSWIWPSLSFVTA